MEQFANQVLVAVPNRDHPATEVYVTGTFDDWKKTEKLEKVGDNFEKKVALPDISTKYFYKVRRSICIRRICIALAQASFIAPPISSLLISNLLERIVISHPPYALERARHCLMVTVGPARCLS
jgi:hypothetical protein